MPQMLGATCLTVSLWASALDHRRPQGLISLPTWLAGSDFSIDISFQASLAVSVHHRGIPSVDMEFACSAVFVDENCDLSRSLVIPMTEYSAAVPHLLDVGSTAQLLNAPPLRSFTDPVSGYRRKWQGSLHRTLSSCWNFGVPERTRGHYGHGSSTCHESFSSKALTNVALP
ncbi:hypothetical protein P280DRAFT_538191 [Massarina eburnea CBS 473.64]|uniref:Uncharacterized protein n=1 Tax=Massarina eburnea CBS 473.64 TaxID=1395130 RepID=A0A6A6SAT3_9PLEO|nr:hypothetical protein P280DRAFT_538191 [Massarina eburnea CBS 473.64]